MTKTTRTTRTTNDDVEDDLDDFDDSAWARAAVRFAASRSEVSRDAVMDGASDLASARDASLRVAAARVLGDVAAAVDVDDALGRVVPILVTLARDPEEPRARRFAAVSLVVAAAAHPRDDVVRRVAPALEDAVSDAAREGDDEARDDSEGDDEARDDSEGDDSRDDRGTIRRDDDHDENDGGRFWSIGVSRFFVAPVRV